MPTYEAHATENAGPEVRRPRKRTFFLTAPNLPAAEQRAMQDAVTLHGFTDPLVALIERRPNMEDAR